MRASTLFGWLSSMLFVAFLFGWSTQAVSQENLLLERAFYQPLGKILNNPEHQFHTAVKPYLVSEVGTIVGEDSIHGAYGYPISRWVNKNDSIIDRSSRFGGGPLFAFLPGYEIGDTKSKYLSNSFFGAYITGKYKDKFYLRGTYATANYVQPEFLKNYSTAQGVVPGMGYAFGTENGHHFKNATGYISYSPSEIFNLQLGHGKNFWGDGYRSLLLSDVANNYSYLKITTTIWKFKYINLFADLYNIRGSGGDRSDFTKKYGAFHLLSYNVSKRFNIALFEAVIWGGEDSLLSRRFDVNYLNPVIFFRPVEFSLGSHDNTLVGINMSYKAATWLQLYGQIVIDEFFVKEVLAQDGWWGNKQGFQIGFNYFDVGGVPGLGWQTEFNYVRPYTYSHAREAQNYAHFNQSLAHPLGANFTELIVIGSYAKNNWMLEAKGQFGQYGTDYAGRNLGQDIFKSNLERDNEFNNTTGQGIQNDLLTAGLKMSYLILPAANLRFSGEWMYRNHKIGTTAQNTQFFMLGLQTSLGNFYNDF